MKGSMELLADRDPEEARKILDPVLEHMMEAVHRYEGTREPSDGGWAIGSDLKLDYTAVGQTTNLQPQRKRVAAAAADKRINVIDACMTAVPSTVRQGGLTFLVGGPKALFDRAKPHLLQMAKDAFHMGPLGCGNVTKLFKNMVTASEGLIIYEALQIAKAGGVSYRAALELMQKTKSQHVLDRWKSRFDVSGDELKFNPGTNLYDKDLPLAAEVGTSLGADIPVVEALSRLGTKLNGGKVSI